MQKSTIFTHSLSFTVCCYHRKYFARFETPTGVLTKTQTFCEFKTCRQLNSQLAQSSWTVLPWRRTCYILPKRRQIFTIQH